MDQLDKELIRYIQKELPIVPEPFKSIARQLGITQEELIDRIKVLKSLGIVRRMGAVLNHRNVGFVANAMVVWAIPENEIEPIGLFMSEQKEISHCYQRNSYPGWPYNLYTMIHAKTKEECEYIIKRISQTTGIQSFEVLYSTTELKKASYLYFE